MFRFESPHVFIWLLSIPILWLLAIVFQRQAKRKMQNVIHQNLLPFLTSSISLSRRRWKLILQSLVVAFFILALARPQMGESKTEIKSEGVELMLVVDVSDSMMAEDIRPNRLEQAKTEMSKLVDMLSGNKIGIIAFAGSAALLSPLTSDPSSLKMYLDSLSPESVSTQGTEFKKALDEADAAFDRGGVDIDDSTKVTRVILLASDGEDQEPGAMDEAEKLVKKGVRIFSLAYGTEKGAPIPERDGMGNLRGYKKDQSGQTVLTTVKGDALRALAQAGQGSFYHASYGGSHLQRTVDDINKLQKTMFSTEMATQYDEQFQIFIFFGILWALLEIVLGDRRPASKLWKGRFEVAEAEGER
ncbi:MAG: hypothetical protein COT73_12295 [Bdellovibrio sp. CG10_big_fil_rev_8_21_14_0_10_47_8]|nr:MAG: hypothetical protein COT73_12295 [Bdellovibrio sp. CG10_big_fil_rev_8_21_14_0_10_47_8]